MPLFVIILIVKNTGQYECCTVMSQLCLLQANEWNDAIESVVDWLPLAEEKLKFRSVPDNEHELVQFLDSHDVCHVTSLVIRSDAAK